MKLIRAEQLAHLRGTYPPGTRVALVQMDDPLSIIPDKMSHLRELIVLLRGAGIGLDYPMLAADLYRYRFQDRAHGVRLRWGQDYYRKTEEDERND